MTQTSNRSKQVYDEYEAYYNKNVLKMMIQETPFLKTQNIKVTSKHGSNAQAIQCKFRTN